MTLLIVITLGCSFSSPQIPRHVTEAAAKPLLSDPSSVRQDNAHLDSARILLFIT